MATSLATTLSLSLRATLTNTLDLSTPKDDLSYAFADALSQGTGLDAGDVLWHDTRTLTATTSENLDLAGSLTNGLGTTVTFAKVKAIIIVNKSTTAGYNLDIGNATSNGWTTMFGGSTHTIKVGPGGCFANWNPSLAGFAVTAATGDQLKINNGNAASVDYDIVIIGTSA